MVVVNAEPALPVPLGPSKGVAVIVWTPGANRYGKMSLLDVNLGTMTGAETCRVLQQGTVRPAVVLMSGYRRSELSTEIEALGVRFVAKDRLNPELLRQSGTASPLAAPAILLAALLALGFLGTVYVVAVSSGWILCLMGHIALVVVILALANRRALSGHQGGAVGLAVATSPAPLTGSAHRICGPGAQAAGTRPARRGPTTAAGRHSPAAARQGTHHRGPRRGGDDAGGADRRTRPRRHRRPAPPRPRPVPPVLAIRGVTDALREAIGMIVNPTVTRLEPEVETAVYFCCVEALQNAAKHAGPATTITVEIAQRSSAVVFSVSDDGPGFDAACHGDGSGLVNMADLSAQSVEP